MRRSTDSLARIARGAVATLAVALCASATIAGTGGSNQIRAIDVSQKAGKTKIEIVGSSRPTYTAFKLSSPKRLIVDLADARIKGVPSVIDESTALVSGVAISEYTSGGVPVSRVMIGFKEEAAYRVRVSGTKLLITLSGGPQPEEEPTIVDDSSGEEVALAEAEAEKARDALADAEKELAALRDDAAAARSEAESARKALERTRAEVKRSESARTRSSRKAKKQHEEQIGRLESQIAGARAQVAAEQSKREKLEKRLSNLQAALDAANESLSSAERSEADARAEADLLRKASGESASVAKAAEETAREALVAQRAAAEAYREAAESEKAKLLKVLRERERDTVEAKKRLAEAEGSKRSTDEKMRKAMARLSAAAAEAADAARAKRQIEIRTGKELAAAEKKRKRAERAAELAGKRAERAEAEKSEIEKELGRVRSQTERKAAERVASAQKRLEEAERVSRSLEEKVAEMEDLLARADEKASRYEEELAEAKTTIADQERRLSELSKPRAAESEPASEEAAPAPRKMTQEEKRLARLAEMQKKRSDGEKGDEKGDEKEDGARTGEGPMIADVEFLDEEGVQKVVITADDHLEYTRTTDADGNAALVFENTSLAPMLERTLDVTGFEGILDRVNSYNEGGVTKIEVEVGRLASNEVVRSGNEIEWVFEARKGPSKRIERVSPQGNKSRTVAREDDGAYEYPVERTAAYAVKLTGPRAKKKHYTGRRIDLDFKDADIHNILRLLADVGHVNIVTADDVSGSVTIRMRNVPWDHALDVILRAKRLGMVREGNLLRVAPLSTLEKEREMEIARRKQFQAMEPLETRLIPVSYAQAGELKPRAADMLGERGKLSVDSRTNVIIARDTVENLNQIEALIRNLDTQTPQVLIEGRIVEASSTYAREIGIQWGGDFSSSAATGNPTGLAFPSTIGVAGGATDSRTPTSGLGTTSNSRPNPNFAVNLPAAVGSGSGGALGITLGSIANNANLNLRLSAMEEEGTLRILSSPKILTLDNREAHIEQGTLIPYSRISAQGIQTAFKEAKLNLTVTPHVTADGSVLLNLTMTRDEPDFNNKGARGDPTILKREAKTELLVSDGHTAVIGGIFTRNHGTSYKKVPLLGDIPVLGILFKKRSDSDRRSEMLIFITPRIVNRAESIGQ